MPKIFKRKQELDDIINKLQKKDDKTLIFEYLKQLEALAFGLTPKDQMQSPAPGSIIPPRPIPPTPPPCGHLYFYNGKAFKYCPNCGKKL